MICEFSRIAVVVGMNLAASGSWARLQTRAHAAQSEDNDYAQGQQKNERECRTQQLAGMLDAWAVLSSGVPETGAGNQRNWVEAFFKEAAAQDVTSFTQEGLSQLLAAHLYAQHLGIPGLSAGPVLEAARAAGWIFEEPTISASQVEVASALRQLGCTVRLEMKSPDGLMSADVGVTALPDGSPCSIAVEYDGQDHFVTVYSSSGCVLDRLDATRLRNALLQPHFPDGVVCIPGKDWVAATMNGQQEEYLRKVMASVMG
jgi:hypothetical protein